MMTVHTIDALMRRLRSLLVRWRRFGFPVEGYLHAAYMVDANASNTRARGGVRAVIDQHLSGCADGPVLADVSVVMGAYKFEFGVEIGSDGRVIVDSVSDNGYAYLGEFNAKGEHDPDHLADVIGQMLEQAVLAAGGAQWPIPTSPC